MNTHPENTPQQNHRKRGLNHVAKRLLALSLIVAALIWAPTAIPCGGTRPLTPRCAKTVVVNRVGPGAQVVLAPLGGPFTFDTTIFATGSSFFPGPACPQPVSADVKVELFCNPLPDATGSLTGVALTPGFNNIAVPIAIPPGPPRVCSVVATAAVTFADGSIVTAVRHDVEVCIVEPAPGVPGGVPRLDLQLLTPSVQPLHAGDVGTLRYRLTNNDPAESVTVELKADSENSSVVPDDTSQRRDVYGVSDPVGDAFPIYFADEIPPGVCPPLPPDPQNQFYSDLSRSITLPPGQSLNVDFLTRSYGGCATGSCNEVRVRLDGNFSGGDPALACASSAVVVDNSQPPSFSCPGVGSVAQAFVVDPILKIAGFQMVVNPGLPALPIQFQTVPSGFTGLTVQNDMLQEDTNESVRGLTRLTPGGGGNFVPGTVVTGEYLMLFSDPTGQNNVNPLRFSSPDDAPNGYQNLAPLVKGVLQTTPAGPGGLPRSIVEPMIQYGAQSFLPGGQPGPVLSVNVIPDPLTTAIFIEVAIPDSGPPLSEIVVLCDVRMYGFQEILIPPFPFDGTLTRPLGNAQLQPSPDGHLIVSNIGSSGLDGVRVDIPDSPGLGDGGAFLPFLPLPLGPPPFQLTLQARILEPTSILPQNGGAVTIQSSGLNQVQFTPDFSPLGAQTRALVQVVRDGKIVGTSTGPPAAPAATLRSAHPNVGMPECTGCGKLASGFPFPLPCFFFEFDRLGEFTLGNGRTAVGDRVVILAVDSSLQINRIVRLDLRVAGPPVLVLTGVEESDPVFPDESLADEIRREELEKLAVTPPSPWLHVFGHPHRALGNARLLAGLPTTAGGTGGGGGPGPLHENLIVSNIGSSGEDGVRIELGEAEYAVVLEFVDLSPPGSALDITGQGTVGGTPGQNLGNFGFRNNNGQLRAFADFTVLGTPTVRVDVLNGGVPVGTATVPAGQIGVVTPVPGTGIPRINGCGKLPPFGPPCFFIRVDRPLRFTPAGSPAPLVGDEVRALAVGLPNPIDILESIDVTGRNLGVFGILGESSPPPPVVTGVNPASGQPGDIIRITGSGFDPCPDNMCVVIMQVGNNVAIPLEVLTATATEMRVRLGPVPPAAAGIPGQVMVGTGRGAKGRFDPVLPGIIVAEPVWVWDFIGQDNENQPVPPPTFTPNPAPPVPGTVWFHADQPQNGEICLKLEDPTGLGCFNWPNPAKVQINARLRDHNQNNHGHDQFASCLTFTNNISPLECAEKICDSIRCAWLQQFGILVECIVRIDPATGCPVVCLTFPDGEVTWGSLTICVTPIDDPVITSVTPPSGGSGDIITIHGSGFDPDPDNMCVILMQGGSNVSIGLEVLAARDEKIIARLGPVPPGATPGEIMIGRGEGRRALFQPAFPEIVVEEPVWVWDRDGAETTPGNPNAGFTPVPTPPPANTRWFHAGPPPGGPGSQICVQIPQALVGNWDPECKLTISARIHDHAAGIGHDQLSGCVRFDGFLTPPTYADCMERICDTIRCAWSQILGVSVICTFDPFTESICIGFGDPGLGVDWGNLTVCIECPNPAPPAPVITGINSATGKKGDIVRVTGTGFGNNPDNICAVVMQGDVEVQTFDEFEGFFKLLPPDPAFPGQDILQAPLGAVIPCAVPGPVMLGIGEGNRGRFEPLFPEITPMKPSWVWVNDPRVPDAAGPNFTPQEEPPGLGQQWFFSEPPANGVMCIFIDGNWGLQSKVTISGRMRDHATGKGYDQFSSSVMINGPMTALECAHRICDTLQCAWSQLAGVRVICVATPVGNNGAKITLLFENGSVDWGNITVCVDDLSVLLTYEQWKLLHGIVNDDDDDDGDGLVAILEAYIGTDPHVRDTHLYDPLLGPRFSPLFPANFALRYQRDPAMIGIAALIEGSIDLVNFFPFALNPAGSALTGTVVLPVPVGALGDKGFFRFKLTPW